MVYYTFIITAVRWLNAYCIQTSDATKAKKKKKKILKHKSCKCRTFPLTYRVTTGFRLIIFLDKLQQSLSISILRYYIFNKREMDILHETSDYHKYISHQRVCKYKNGYHGKRVLCWIRFMEYYNVITKQQSECCI